MKRNRTLINRIILMLLALSVMSVAAAQSAFATTAANNIIRNTAQVDYQDSSGTVSFSATSAPVDVTVALAESTPTLNAPTDQTTDAATAAIYNYTIDSTANGPDTYNLTVVAPIGESAGINSSTAVLSTPNITLGGSSVAVATTINAAGTTTITVPSDNLADGLVNGIDDTSTVVINNAVFTVASVDDTNATNPGTSTITVNGNGTATAVAIGDQIGERGTFTLTVTPGTVTASGDQTITVTINARDDASAQPIAPDTTITTVQGSDLSITKTVAPATAAPGQLVTYTITVTNNGSTNATDVRVTDAAPTFTTYEPNTTLLNGKAVAGDGATLPLDVAGGMLVDDDNPVRAAGAVASGIIQPTASAVIEFQVRINN